MKLRVTRARPSLTQEVIEGELVICEVIPNWRPATDIADIREAVGIGKPLALLVQSPDGLALWCSTPVEAIHPREGGGWLIKTNNTICGVEELAEDVNSRRVRRSTGIIPVLAKPDSG